MPSGLKSGIGAAASTAMDCHRRSPYGADAMPTPDERRDQERRTALSELERLRHGGETILGATADAARRTAAHFAGRDAEPQDRIEIWGRRIGRSLALVAVVALALHLYFTYLQ